MRPIHLLLLLPLAGFLLPTTEPAARGQEDGIDAAGLFAKSCASCHSIPDPDLPGDRAFLAQVKDTA